MTSPFGAILALLLACPLGVAGTRILGSARMQQDTNGTSAAYFCPSLCVRCEDGERTVLVKRAKGLLKTVADIGVATNAVFNPFPGTTLFTASVVALEKALIHNLGDECPNVEIYFLENGEVNKVPEATLSSLMTKDDYLGSFKKNLGRIYAEEQKEKGIRQGLWDWTKSWVSFTRPTGTMPDVVSSYVDHSDLFCGAHEGIAMSMKENGIVEEGKIRSGLSYIPLIGRWVSFGQHCESIAKDSP